MLKKTMKFVDFNGTEREEDFHFHLTQAEITEMELSVDGGFVQYVNDIVAEQSGPKMVQLFKDLILKSYGKISPDGRRFIKNDEVREEFSQTNAYSDLFMELATNSDAATTFVNGIIPKDLLNKSN